LAERDGYTLGQSIASNAVVQLQMVKDVGLTISMDQLIAGLTTQLKTGTSAIGGEEMSHRYAQMQAAMNKGMGPLIEKGYAQLDKQVENRKTLRSENGVRWFAVKPVKAKLIPDQQVEVSVKISTLGGKVINDFADDKVPFDNNLPPLLYDGMSLTGQGGAVEGWALAKDILEREPLPPWVAPYDVIHYQLAIK
jgi:NOL1/NOP2/fmu family ribosome biogenesis protein